MGRTFFCTPNLFGSLEQKGLLLTFSDTCACTTTAEELALGIVCVRNGWAWHLKITEPEPATDTVTVYNACLCISVRWTEMRLSGDLMTIYLRPGEFMWSSNVTWGCRHQQCSWITGELLCVSGNEGTLKGLDFRKNCNFLNYFLIEPKVFVSLVWFQQYTSPIIKIS